MQCSLQKRGDNQKKTMEGSVRQLPRYDAGFPQPPQLLNWKGHVKAVLKWIAWGLGAEEEGKELNNFQKALANAFEWESRQGCGAGE